MNIQRPETRKVDHVASKNLSVRDDHRNVGLERRSGKPPKGTDLWAVQSGRISVTPLQLDFTDEETRAKLAAALGE